MKKILAVLMALLMVSSIPSFPAFAEEELKYSDDASDFVLLADGGERKLDAPKRKRRKHVRGAGTSAHPAILGLQRGEPITDRSLRRALAAFRDSDPEEGGNTLV